MIIEEGDDWSKGVVPVGAIDVVIDGYVFLGMINLYSYIVYNILLFWEVFKLYQNWY